MARSEYVAIRICGVDVVERIERIHAELGCNVHMNRERLRDGHIRIEERRAAVCVRAGVSNHVETREREQLRLRCPEVAADRATGNLRFRQVGLDTSARIRTARCGRLTSVVVAVLVVTESVAHIYGVG